MPTQSFKDLIVWQKSMNLARTTYTYTDQFPKTEIYGLTNQMRRAAVSIPSNIAEGSRRKNVKEYIQFLRISYGSAAELETQLILAKDLFSLKDTVELDKLLEEVCKMLNTMLQRLDTTTYKLSPTT